MPTAPRRIHCGTSCAGPGPGTPCWARSSAGAATARVAGSIDPIDGTKSFVRGVPVWATLIGLMDGDEVVVGVVSAPALGRRWWAATGNGAWTGRSLTKATRCAVSGVTRLSDASLSFSSLGGWEDRGKLDGFLGLTRAVWRTRAYGDFWSHVLVAEGAVDVSLEPEVSLWDVAAAAGHRGRGGRPFQRRQRCADARRRQRRLHQRTSAR